MKRFLSSCLLALALLTTPPLAAQEPLDAILARGYVAHWLVCGPFASALEMGIVDTVRAGLPAVGGRDFMEGDGGIERIRPKHRQPIKVPGYADGVWQRAGTEGPQLDLSPFYPDAPEGLSYAGFYTEAAAPVQALLELHTPLGAQAWLNGAQVLVSQASALPLAGVDRALVQFRQGSNFLVIQTAGARLDALAEAAGVSPRELSSQTFANRTLLKSSSGFEIALTLKQVSALGGLVYTPTLSPTGSFSGTLGDVRQDAALSLFNPGDARSSLAQVLVKSPLLPEPLLVEVPGVPPGERVDAILSLPVGGALPGSSVSVNITLMHEGERASFDASFNVLPRGDGGEVMLLTGTRHVPKERESPAQRMLRQADELSAQLALSDTEAAYGFEAGHAATWQAWLALHPDALERWNALLAAGRGGVSAQYAGVDERVASPELLVRNVQLGIEASRIGMGTPGIYDAWRAPGLAPQTPQLLSQARIPGLLSSLQLSALVPLAKHAGLAREPVLHRHVVASEGPVTVEGLRNDVAKRRRELSDLGFDTSLLLLENAIAPPEPFLRGASEDLARSFPSIKFSGAGALSFFDTARQSPAVISDTLPVVSHGLLGGHPGELLTNPEMQSAYSLISERMAAVETLSTLAALEGGRYPGLALDRAWRLLAWHTQPEYLAARAGSETAWRMLDALREVKEILDTAEGDALDYLAGLLQIDPPALPEGVEPLGPVLLYAPGGVAGARVCSVHAPVPSGKEVVAYDREGASLPVRLREPLAQTEPSTRSGTPHRIEILLPMAPWSVEVVQLGLRPMAKPTSSSELLIENDLLLAQFDPETGHLVQLLNKQTGLDAATGPLNDIIALGLDTAKSGQGRELWTSGDTVQVSGPPTSVETFRGDGFEEIRMLSPFGEGQLERRLKLMRGLPYVEVEARVSGLSGGPRLLVSAASTSVAGCAPVFGERFGALSGRFDAASLIYQSESMNRPSADGLHPAYRWAAVSAGPELRFGLKRSLPLLAASVVRGPKPAHAASAQAVQAALWHVGVPSTAHAASGAKPDALWTDGTPLPDALAALEAHTGMLIVIGAPEEVPLMKRVLEGVPEEARQRVARGLERGGIYAATLRDATPDGRVVPVLLFVGRDPDVLDDLVTAFAEGLMTLGFYTLPEEALLDGEVAPASHAGQGLAVLFPGTSAASASADGRLVLAHGVHSGEPGEALAFRYALYPFGGDWRDARVPDMAEHYALPVMSRDAAVNAGTLVPGTPLLTLSAPGLHVTALKPAGVSSSVAEGVALRGYVDTLSAWQGEAALRGPLTGASQSDVREQPGTALPVSAGQVTAQAASGDILTLWLLPQSVGRLRNTVAGNDPSPGPLYAAYPKSGESVSPTGGPVCGIQLTATWEGEQHSARVKLANLKEDRVLEGVLSVTASDGWSIGPEKQTVRIEPGKVLTVDLLLASLKARPGTGSVMAALDTGAGTWFDVAREGEAWLDLAQRAEPGRIVLDVTNRMGVRAQGQVSVVTDPLLWPGWTVPAPESAAHPAVHPRTQPIDLPPLGKQQLTFLVSSAGEQPVRGVLLVSANGQTEQLNIGAPAR